MAIEIAHSFAGVTTKISADQGIASIHIDGLVTDKSSSELLGACHVDLDLLRPAAMVAAYDSAQMGVTAHTLLSSARRAMPDGSLLRIPTALVVNPDDLEMWRTYCYLQGMFGIMRAAFTDHNAARAWAADQAALRAAQLRYLAARARVRE